MSSQRFILAAILSLVGLPAGAGEWLVTGLWVQGQPAAGVEIRRAVAPSAAWQPLRVDTGTKIPEGSRINVPREVEIELVNQGARVAKRQGSQGDVVLDTPANRGRVGRVFAGLFRWAIDGLDTVEVAVGVHRARTEGTEFDIGYQDGVATFQTFKGRIEVTEFAAVQVGDRPALAQPRRHRLAAGDPKLELPDSAERYLVRFGTYDDAVAWFTAAADRARQRLDADAEFNALLALGDVLRVAGRGAAALDAYQRAQPLVAGADDAYWRALLQGRRGDALRESRQFAAAAAAYAASVDAHRAAPLRDDEDAANDQRANLALVQLDDGTLRCADTTAAAVLRRLDERPATRYTPTRAAMLEVQAAVAVGLGRPAAAQPLLAQALSLRRIEAFPSRQATGRDATEALALALNAEGAALTALGRYTDAQARHLEAQAIADQLFSTPHGLQADAALGLAALAAARGRPADALAQSERAVRLLDAAPDDPLRRADARTMRAELWLAGGRAPEAVAGLREARALLTGIWPDQSHPRFQTLLPALAKAQRRSGGAEADAREAEASARSGAAALRQREQACLR
jgi:tetratricopeptide (TPR) repeat protein